jgi:hypothetical protein
MSKKIYSLLPWIAGLLLLLLFILTILTSFPQKGENMTSTTNSAASAAISAVHELRETVIQFIAEQKKFNEMACKHEIDLHGNGKEGALTTLKLIDGRIQRLEEQDTRRKKMIDGLIAAFSGMVLIEIIRLISAALP